MVGKVEGKAEEPADGGAPGDAEGPAEAAEPGADGPVAQVSRVTKLLLLGAAFLFLVLPAVAMLVLLTSGSDLSNLVDGFMSEFGKQLSSVGHSL
jgi:hypothetical protein